MQHDNYESGVTQGISPKAILAGAIPALATLFAVLIQLVITGHYDQAELVTTLTGLSGSLLAGLAAYLGSPGDVRYRPAAPRAPGARRTGP